MEDDKFEVGIGPAKLTATGTGVSRIGEAVDDLISPFSQGFGLIGDHIRMHRERSVGAVLKKAAEIAAERKDPIEPVNPKNLIPIIEDASLEDPDDNELLDLWARLLLSGGKQFDAQLAVFSDTLRRIGAAEAAFLQKTVTKDSNFPKYTFPDLDDHYDSSTMRDNLELLSQIEEDSVFQDSARAMFRDRNWVTYGVPLYVGEINEKFGAEVKSFFPEYWQSDRNAAEILEKEGLAKIESRKFQFERGIFSVTYCRISALGVALIVRCYPKEE